MSDEKRDARAVVAAVYVAAADAVDAPVTLEIIPVEPESLPAAMVRMLPGDPVARRYRCGDWIGRQKWALYLRVDARDTAQRVEAVATLQEASDRLEAAPLDLPEGFEHRSTEADGTPTMQDAAEGYETWQVTFETQFKRYRS